MIKAHLQPTIDDTYRIVYDSPDDATELNFDRALQRSQKQETDGDIEGACNTRYMAFQQLMELIPEDENVVLDWDDEDSRNALLLISFTAIDHFLIGDFEMCAGMLEMILELDPEDHTEATKRLAYCYVALEEYELFDEIINDISDKYAEKSILKLWSDLRRNGRFSDGELIYFKKSFGVYFHEFVGDNHDITSDYLSDIESEHPSREALARELWLQTEHLWALMPGFIEALKAKA